MTKLGIIGFPSDWLISCHVEKEVAKDVFDIELVDINIDEVETNYHRFENNQIPEGKFKASWDQKELQKAYSLYLAIKQITIDHNLEGFTIRCFDLLSSLKTTSCLALALLNSEGIIATCEGDVPAMITMYVAKKIADRESFQANPSLIDVDKNQMIIAHCTLPLNMCTSYTFKTHFESGIGVGIKGELKEDRVNVLRLNSALNKFVILKGKIIENLNRDNLCRTQIVIQYDKDSDVKYFLKNPLGNHHIVIYGDNYTILKEYFEKCGLQEVK